MPFSFNPGQEQTNASQTAQAMPASNNGVPVLNVPVAPTISLTPVVEPISMFAYRNRSKSKFGAYFQFAIFGVFGVLAIASMVLFVYQTTLKANIETKKAELLAAEKNFKEIPLEDMQKLASRLAKINTIINERASVRTAFAIIEDSINDPVTYNKFSLAKSKKDKNYYDLSFAGETDSYVALYQQINVYNSPEFAKVFRGKLNIGGIGPLDKKGLVSFKIDTSVAISGIDSPETFSVIGTSTRVISTSTKATSDSEVRVATSSSVVNPVNLSTSSDQLNQ